MNGHDGRVTPTFRQVIVTDRHETVLVELAHDARRWPSSVLSIGAVLSIQELAADKTLALFGRAEARDLLDVHALAQRCRPWGSMEPWLALRLILVV
jgi:predicted nucleotidyltransferase component of viral defense system